jgi:hypothetical protein
MCSVCDVLGSNLNIAANLSARSFDRFNPLRTAAVFQATIA